MIKYFLYIMLGLFLGYAISTITHAQEADCSPFEEDVVRLYEKGVNASVFLINDPLEVKKVIENIESLAGPAPDRYRKNEIVAIRILQFIYRKNGEVSDIMNAWFYYTDNDLVQCNYDLITNFTRDQLELVLNGVAPNKDKTTTFEELYKKLGGKGI